MLSRFKACLLLALTSSPSLFGADFAMRVTDKNYLDTQGFSVFLYDSTYHPVFVDQKNTAMEMTDAVCEYNRRTESYQHSRQQARDHQW